MAFDFDCSASAGAFRSLKNLVNTNGGVWKSRKQREFLLSGSRSPLKPISRDIKDGVRAVHINAHVRKGSTRIPVQWEILVDMIGVQSVVRVRKDCREQEFQREDTVDHSHLDQPTPEELADRRQAFNEFFAARHVGTVGQRQELELTLTGLCPRGEYVLNFLKDGRGNLFMYAGKKLGKQGDTVRVRATIHAHSQNRMGAALNILKRPFVVKQDDTVVSLPRTSAPSKNNTGNDSSP